MKTCDRQMSQTDQLVGHFSCAVVSVLSASLQDGMVQAAALREGLQRFLHQGRHQEGSQVSGSRLQHT